MSYFIAVTDFKDYEDVSINIKPERLAIYIKQAHELDLKPFFGHAMYYDCVKTMNGYNAAIVNDPSYTATPKEQKYIDLIEGIEYTDLRGHTIIYEGLKPTLIYFAFARFIDSNGVRYTETGNTKKHHENSDSLDPKETAKEVEKKRSIANAHANEVEKFLYDHKSIFDLWHINIKNKDSRQPGPRIRGIDRNHFNYPDGYSYHDPYRNILD